MVIKMKIQKAKTAASLLLAGVLAVSACFPASAAARPLAHPHRWEKDWYGKADVWFHADQNTGNAAYPNAVVLETEEDSFYYPASAAELLHDGHGNFTVSGLTGGAISSDDFFTTVITPGTGSGSSGGSAAGSSGYPDAPSSWQGAASFGSAAGAGIISAVPEGSRLGTLTVRGRSIQVYEGTSSSAMLKGAGHFTGTSAWDGNVCLCGHNRGPNAWFSDLIHLTPGERITYQTALGTRTYQVTGTRIVSVNDISPLNASVQNRLTLVTCLANRPDVRLIVTAKQVL